MQQVGLRADLIPEHHRTPSHKYVIANPPGTPEIYTEGFDLAVKPTHIYSKIKSGINSNKRFHHHEKNS